MRGRSRTGTHLRALALAAALGTSVGACDKDGDGALSVATSCRVLCDQFVTCFSDDPVNDENVEAACDTVCRDADEETMMLNGSSECQQSWREYVRCIGAESTCQQLETFGADEELCRSEAIDVIDLCPGGVGSFE